MSRARLPAVVQVLERGAEQRGELGADLHQVQQLLAVRQEAVEFLGAREERAERHLLVEFGFGDRHYLDVRERGAEGARRHLQALQHVREQQPVSGPEAGRKKKKKKARTLETV